MRSRHAGLTLIELIVVVCIIALCAVLLLDRLRFYQEAAEKAAMEYNVGVVKSAEIVSHKYNEKSKGFGFVTMTTIDEAKRAVTELHDKEFMGRKLVVSGAKTGERETNYRG